MDQNDADQSAATNAEGQEKPGGLGQDGTIPSNPSGVAAGHTGQPSSFEPEEDEMADPEDTDPSI